jgi:hypothetical protein
MNKVQKKTNNAIAAVDESMFMADAQTQSGLENVSSADDLALPFLKVLSQLSPQCNKTSNNYVENAEPGMIYNTVSGTLFDGEQGIDVIPCHYKREFIEWGERGKGSGAPVAVHDADYDISQAPRDANFQNRLPNGNVIDETANHYVLVVGEDGYEQALITMKAIQRKVSRKWNSMMLGIKMQGKEGPFTPPSYSHIYKLRTVPQSNAKGTWFGWDIQKVGPVQDKGTYDAAKLFSQGVSKNTVKVSHEEESQTASSSSY